MVSSGPTYSAEETPAKALRNKTESGGTAALRLLRARRIAADRKNCFSYPDIRTAEIPEAAGRAKC